MIHFSKLRTKGAFLLPLSVALSLSLANADELSQSSSSTNTSTSAESTDSKVENMDKVKLQRSVVTASGYAQDIKDAPASISVVDKEDILTRPIRDIGDAVQDVPGVYVESSKTGGNTITMRGLSSAYTLILIDGKRQNVAQGFADNGFDGVFASFMPPPSMIERIEVIRGPASIIYGSDAMGGVINIITKKNPNKLSASVQLETRLPQHNNVFGNTYGANAYLATPLIKDKLSLNLRGGYRYGGQNAFLRPIEAVSINPYHTHSASGYTSWNAGGRLVWTPDSHNYFYLDSEIYFTRAGTLNTSPNQFAVIRDHYKINNVLSHEADYEWGKVASYVQYSRTFWAPHTQNDPYIGTTSPRPNLGGGITPWRLSGDSIDWDSMRDNQDIVLQSTYTNTFDFNKYGVLGFNGGVYYLWEQFQDKSNNFLRAMN